MKKITILSFMMFMVLSCTNNVAYEDTLRVQYKKDEIKRIVYLKDSTVNLCYAVIEDHFGDKQITCVPCDSVKNKLK